MKLDETQWDGPSLLAWLNESYSHVLEYSADCHRAYIQDEDSDEVRRYIPVTLARQLLADGKIAVWRYIGQHNKGYHTYKTAEYVAAWKREHPIEIYAQPVRLALSSGDVA